MPFIFHALRRTIYYHKHLLKRKLFRPKLFMPYGTSKISIIEPELQTMKFDTPEFRALFTPETKFLSELFQKYGYELRIAGGAVRDLLMHKEPVDVDFATTATPEEMIKMFTAEGVRMFNKKGESHGTVTVRVNDQQNFEITTLRVDLHTDGRHAEVEFTTNWELDAARRDLTINAMFLGLDGILHDYFHGVDDLERRKVKFVGDPASRIKEDYLRILRYFRFYGRIALKPDDHDANTLQAIRENVDGLEKISGERLWIELKKILSGNYVKQIVLRMLDLGIGLYIGFPSHPDISEFQRVCDRSELSKPQSVTLLSALLKTADDVLSLHARLKLSKFDRDLALFIVDHRQENYESLKSYKILILESKIKINDIREWVYELLKYKGDSDLLEKLKVWEIPKFPVNGHLLLERGFKSGKKMNAILTELKTLWIESDCTMSREELLGKLDSVAKKV